MGVVLPTATHPWLPFNADWCSVPPSWQVDLLQAIINAASSSSVDIARCIVQEPDFGGVTVPFYYACLRHDFNWRNLHRVEHHLDYTASGVWNGAVRAEADERLKQDLIVLCNANQYGEPEVPDTWDWTLSMNNKNKWALRVFVGLRVAGTGWGYYVTRMPRASKLVGLVKPWALRRRTWSRLLVGKLYRWLRLRAA